MKTNFQVSKSYNAESYLIKITYINDIFFYGWADNVAGQEYNQRINGHFHSGVILNMGTDREAIKLDLYNDPDQYKQAEDKVRAYVDKTAETRANGLKSKAENERVEKERTEKERTITVMYDEARQMRQDAITELNKIVCSSANYQAVQKNKRAKELIEQIAFIDAFCKNQYSFQFITE
jgi:hypothetical protein